MSVYDEGDVKTCYSDVCLFTVLLFSLFFISDSHGVFPCRSLTSTIICHICYLVVVTNPLCTLLDNHSLMSCYMLSLLLCILLDRQSFIFISLLVFVNVYPFFSFFSLFFRVFVV
ncbi:hypothetical protein BZA70DRAFT_38840 [Myxozyma melibiosi]|uniref:Uncharacterized protein n=1 Tax=Myxozyma melibiosi TaxID=54550 RepID=A0ABR1FEA2_9ASCO